MTNRQTHRPHYSVCGNRPHAALWPKTMSSWTYFVASSFVDIQYTGVDGSESTDRYVTLCGGIIVYSE